MFKRIVEKIRIFKTWFFLKKHQRYVFMLVLNQGDKRAEVHEQGSPYTFTLREKEIRREYGRRFPLRSFSLDHQTLEWLMDYSIERLADLYPANTYVLKYVKERGEEGAVYHCELVLK